MSIPIPKTPAYWTGATCVILAGILWMIHWRLSIIVLSLYGLWCLTAPFIPRLGFYVPVISRGRPDRKAVALTFDDGPDPLSTPGLLKLLDARRIRATFFISGHKVSKFPQLIEAILKNGHTIGNHSYHHDPFVFFKGNQAIRNEIEATQRALKPFGIVPQVFRPPVGIVGPGLRQPLHTVGMQVVNFSCRAFDCGNRNIRGLAGKILKWVKTGDIILLHDIMPLGISHVQAWLTEMEILLDGLVDNELEIIPLDDLIDVPVMQYIDSHHTNGKEEG